MSHMMYKAAAGCRALVKPNLIACFILCRPYFQEMWINYQHLMSQTSPQCLRLHLYGDSGFLLPKIIIKIILSCYRRIKMVIDFFDIRIPCWWSFSASIMMVKTDYQRSCMYLKHTAIWWISDKINIIMWICKPNKNHLHNYCKLLHVLYH